MASMRLGQSKATQRADEVRYCCPFCIHKIGKADTKFRLYVNFTKRKFNCFVCETQGNTFQLREFLDFRGGTESVNLSLDLLKEKITSLFKQKKNPPHFLDLASWHILSGEAPMAYEYMLARGFTDDEMAKYDIRVGKRYEDPKTKKFERKWSGRIIFPFYDEGEIVYLIGRAYAGAEPKYINSKGNRDRVVYGIDNVAGECVICEGIISSIAAERKLGRTTVALLGKHISDFQLAKLRAKAHRVWVCLDGTEDVTGELKRKFNRRLIMAGFEVWDVSLPLGKDPDEVSQDELVQCFNGARKVSLV